jgi:hypothetical protein
LRKLACELARDRPPVQWYQLLVQAASAKSKPIASEEIVVTPAMAEAGSIELSSFDIDADYGTVIVSAIYRRMTEVRQAELHASSEASPPDRLSASGSPSPAASS